MVQYIKNADIWGRVGSGVGRGLAEQLPKEIERGRLQAGLKELENMPSNLTPVQQFARYAAIPGLTPQDKQSLGELLRYQNRANAYRNVAGAGGAEADQQASPQGMAPGIRDVEFARRPGEPRQLQRNMPSAGQVDNRQRTPNQLANEDIPEVTSANVLNEANLTRLPWSPQQRNKAISDYMNAGFYPDEARDLAANDEARDLGEAGALRARQDELAAAKLKATDALEKQLSLKLEKDKADPALFKDVKGIMLAAAQRGMIRDLILNPKADIDNVANDWSDRLYRTALAKDKLRTLGKTTGIENFFKGDKVVKQLAEYQDIFKRSGNLEEFQDILRSSDIGMSPRASASVTFPPNPKIDKYVSGYKYSLSGGSTPLKPKEARKAAIEIERDIGPDDSILSIVNAFATKDPNFDKQAFFDQIAEDKDKIGLNERQRLELSEGIGDFLPNWADILYLPSFRGK